MDQTNSSNTNNPSQTNDLAKQYQDILDRYSEELAKEPPPSPSTAPDTPIDADPSPLVGNDLPLSSSNEPLPSPIEENKLITQETNSPVLPPTEPSSQIDTNMSDSSELPDSQDMPLTVVPSPQLSPPPTMSETPPPIFSSNPTEITPPPPIVPLVNSPMVDGADNQPPVPKQSPGIFKFLFIISLLIFLGVFGAIVYSVFFADKTSDQPPLPKSQPSPPPSSMDVCELNDKKYAVGESFTAADGCNICSCSPDLTIVCSEESCDTTPVDEANPPSDQNLPDQPQ